MLTGNVEALVHQLEFAVCVLYQQFFLRHLLCVVSALFSGSNASQGTRTGDYA